MCSTITTRSAVRLFTTIGIAGGSVVEAHHSFLVRFPVPQPMATRSSPHQVGLYALLKIGRLAQRNSITSRLATTASATRMFLTRSTAIWLEQIGKTPSG